MCGTNDKCEAYQWKVFSKGILECKHWYVKMTGDGTGDDKCNLKTSGGHLSWFIAKDFIYMK